VWYGLDQSADVWADEVESRGLKGIQFRLHAGGQSYVTQAPLLGRHSVHTVLAAASAALAVGMDLQHIVGVLHNLPPGLRLIVNPGINGSTIIDDTYNASPASVMAALNLLSDVSGRKIAVLADMAELGDYGPVEHEKVGGRAAQVCDLLYVLGPLSEFTVRGALAAGMSRGRVKHLASISEGLSELRAVLRPDDVVLLKGSRAMELERLAGALSVPAQKAS
ncbi:MAG: UDP-N-acetylmuramoylalanyl-D-glutamyl-2, 6-diaminopimelate--D-alanyl-D-alanine ligase, partial [Chloroflexota bacterium]|nr:UDP-N-acetylmuramoylalanyl-D-glutamyl-2, 6-diaminopimelate--D-alanyl-D-alanine ligase [Chloroflexota bacterium]